MTRRRLPELRNAYSGVVHAQAECRDCDWTGDNYKNALALASVHARRYGHNTVAESMVSVEHNRPGDDDPRVLGPGATSVESP